MKWTRTAKVNGPDSLFAGCWHGQRPGLERCLRAWGTPGCLLSRLPHASPVRGEGARRWRRPASVARGTPRMHCAIAVLDRTRLPLYIHQQQPASSLCPRPRLHHLLCPSSHQWRVAAGGSIHPSCLSVSPAGRQLQPQHTCPHCTAVAPRWPLCASCIYTPTTLRTDRHIAGASRIVSAFNGGTARPATATSTSAPDGTQMRQASMGGGSRGCTLLTAFPL